uniref:Uncharacterized protein n=1 Tax=Pristionchus pacificus TaxID=54126 RepID=A0A2A6B6W8_PRIPA|eukprot:PDM61625.1 hypothetical protein PRIPAC_51067 [Pristionchus pacificus]
MTGAVAFALSMSKRRIEKKTREENTNGTITVNEILENLPCDSSMKKIERHNGRCQLAVDVNRALLRVERADTAM